MEASCWVTRKISLSPASASSILARWSPRQTHKRGHHVKKYDDVPNGHHGPSVIIRTCLYLSHHVSHRIKRWGDSVKSCCDGPRICRGPPVPGCEPGASAGQLRFVERGPAPDLLRGSQGSVKSWECRQRRARVSRGARFEDLVEAERISQLFNKYGHLIFCDITIALDLRRIPLPS